MGILSGQLDTPNLGLSQEAKAGDKKILSPQLTSGGLEEIMWTGKRFKNCVLEKDLGRKLGRADRLM